MVVAINTFVHKNSRTASLGRPRTLTKGSNQMAKFKIQSLSTSTSVTYPNPVVDRYTGTITINGNHLGGTAGNIAQLGNAAIRTYYLTSTAAAVDTGYMTAQKGRKKFRVANIAGANAGLGNVTTSSLVNKLSSELTVANTMVIYANVATITGVNVANIGTGGSGYTNNRAYAYLTWTGANLTGIVAPTVGYQMRSTGAAANQAALPTGNVTVVAVNSATNVTVSCSTQTVATNAAARLSVTEGFAVSRIDNLYVHDFNNVKYRYWMSAPYVSPTNAPLTSQPGWQANVIIQVDNA